MYVIHSHITSHSNVAGRKTKNGDVVCKRRWSYPCAFHILQCSIVFTGLLRYHHHLEHKQSFFRELLLFFTRWFSHSGSLYHTNKISVGIHTISFSQKCCNLGLVGIFDEHKDDHLTKFSSVPVNVRNSRRRNVDTSIVKRRR